MPSTETEQEAPHRVPLKANYMKKIILSLAISCLCGYFAKAQQAAPFPTFIKSLQRTISYGNSGLADSCFTEVAVLIITIDSATKEGSMAWSDNTSPWISKLFEKEKDRVKMEELTAFAGQTVWGNVFLFPIIIRKITPKCSSNYGHVYIGKDLFLHRGKPLRGMLFDTIEGIFY